MSDIIEKVKDKILDAISNDRLTLPTLPEVALNVREVARNPATTVAQLCAVLDQDAAIAARIIKIANSPLFRGNKSIDNLKMATTRLGVRYTANFATGIAMKQIFQATTSAVDDILRANWEASTDVASFAHAYAQLKPNLHPDQASLAGLTHRIGVLPIVTFAEENRKLLSSIDLLHEIIEATHQEIGMHILRAWGFPEELVIVPMQYTNFSRDIPQADYADLVTISILQGAENPSHPLSHIDLSEVKAFDRLGLRVAADEDQQNQMVEHIELAAAVFND
ncbi:MAG: HDOD domain-containing protein [Gammaproteobacteria bacterium]|nr:HDOD domain-containing protein [Gammaproteobacteria bacterium]NND38792.1 HDOD domain-containing protein [Pseudomonadales bacterium]NNM10862.1 HDOD domain-containing protein [Pseudomonadales bacterium]RZV54851.1 MAG: HDOD domain-containing protein [Pseudomonadales bacterium]